jgi:hypothetical protein
VRVEGDVQDVIIVAQNGLTGHFQIVGDLLGTFTILHPAGDVFEEPPLQITGDLGGELYIPNGLVATVQVAAGTISGHVTVDGTQPSGALLQVGTTSGLTGDVAVNANANGTVEVIGSVASGGLVHVYGDVGEGGLVEIGDGTTAGEIRVDGDLSGTITLAKLTGTAHVLNDLTLGGTVEVTDSGPTLTGLVDIDGNAEGHIHCMGDLTGSIDIAGYLGNNDPNSPLAGRISVDGSFEKANGTDPALIWIHTPLPFGGTPIGVKAYVCVDYDGWDDGDDWDGAARLVIGSDPNDPNNAYLPNLSYHVWHVTSCKGDMNNDASVTMSGDLDAFTVAVNDLIYETANYASQFPGLGGSMNSHGDANCDGTFDSHDINPFVARIRSGDCDCGDSRQGGDGGEGLDWITPEELAALLGDNIAPELYEALLTMVAAAIDAAPDDENQAFWETAYGILTQ